MILLRIPKRQKKHTNISVLGHPAEKSNNMRIRLINEHIDKYIHKLLFIPSHVSLFQHALRMELTFRLFYGDNRH